MNLTEMVNALVADTKMVIKKDELTRRTREAITAIHNSAFFDKDLIEDFVDLNGNLHTNFSIPFPQRFRKFKSIIPMSKVYQPLRVYNSQGRYIKTDVRRLKTYEGSTKADVYYHAGQKINIISSSAPQALHISWYSEPEVADPLLETWIMKQYPQMVMDWAKARFYKANGRANIAGSIEQTLYSIDLKNLQNNHATHE